MVPLGILPRYNDACYLAYDHLHENVFYLLQQHGCPYDVVNYGIMNSVRSQTWINLWDNGYRALTRSAPGGPVVLGMSSNLWLYIDYEMFASVKRRQDPACSRSMSQPSILTNSISASSSAPLPIISSH